MTRQAATKPRKGKPSDLSHPTFSLEHRAPAELVPDPENPRRHPPKQIEALRAAIKEFGFTAPVLIRPTGRIIAGHGRREAAILEALPTVPCWVVDGMTDEQARLLMLADNRIAELSEWDAKSLGATLKSMAQAGVDLKRFDLEPAPERQAAAKGGSAVKDQPLADHFWISVKGPFAHQAKAIEALKGLANIPGVEVHSNVGNKPPKGAP